MTNGGNTSGDGEGKGGQANSEGQAVVELLKVVEPITSATKDGPIGIARLLDDMGISEDLLGRDVSALYDEISSNVETNGAQIDKAIVSIVGEVDEAGVPDIDGLHELDDVNWRVVFANLDYEDVLKNLQSIVSSVKGIFDVVKTLQQIDLQDPDLPSLGEQVVDYLLIRYLRTYRGEVYGFCKLFGVITSPSGKRSGPEEIDLSAIGDALEDPNEIPTELFKWAKQSQPFLASLLLQELLRMSWGKHLPTAIVNASEDERKALTGQDDLAKVDTSQVDGWGQKLMLPLIGVGADDGSRAEAGLQLVPVPPAEDDDFLPGLALVTYGTLTGDMELSLSEDWKVTAEGDGELANRGVAINPSLDDGLNFSFVNTEGSSNSTPGGTSEDQFLFTVELKHVGDPETAKREMVGTLVGGVTIEGLSVAADFEYANDEFSFGVEFTTTGILSIDPQGGFLDKVIPKPIEYDFSLTLGWSTDEGLYLQNGGTLFISLADNIPLGPLTIKETALGLDLGELTGGQGEDGESSPPALPVSFASTPKLDIGFMTAEVMRTGVEADLSFPGGTEGNLGPADLDIGFKPPQGLSLSVNAGPVTGGGMLGFYPDEHRYSGALQLSVGSLSLSAIGLLKTRLPGGKDGYSFLLLITAEFPPVQLGFGFTLNGVGGLLGLHRGMKTKVLGQKVRSGNVDSVLFPQNVVENSQQIISDLRAIFPPKKDVHVVGPMVKMGWGTPTMLTMEVGVVLELPTFEIAIVGAFHLNLPDEEAPLVTINLAVLGVLDIPDERLAITASLYDSRIVMWTVSGDMAMRLRWGDDSTFMLSVGGFHPRYDPPKGFPELDRVKASLGAPSGNPSLEYKGYLATTPNTFQVGAGVYLKAEAGPARVKGELSFDALFQFDPFKFVIDFLAKLSVEIKGKGLSIRVDGTLSGPGPMRVKGKVHIDILFITITAKVDVKLGSGGKKEKLPRARVMPKLTGELGKSGNWAAQVPDSAESLVSIRDHQSESGGGQSSNGDGSGQDRLLTHPLGGVSVRQTVVPLRDRIEKFGNMVPRDYEEFRITEVQVDGEGLETRPNREKFAPAKFKKMSDSEKMNSPSFVKRNAGREAGSGLVYFPGNTEATKDRANELRRTARLEYETSVVDDRKETHAAPLGRLGGFATSRPEVARFGIPLEKVPVILEDGALARADLRGGFTGGDPEVYGVPGGTVIGTREDRILPEDSVTVMPGDNVSAGDGTAVDADVAGQGAEGVTLADELAGVDERFADGGGSLLGGDGRISDPERGGVINIGGNR